MLGMTRYSDMVCMDDNKDCNLNGLEKNGFTGTKCNDKSKKNKVAAKVENLPQCLWDKKVPNTELEKFKKVIEEKYNQHFDSYWELHKWSVENVPQLWEEVWQYLGVIYSKPHDEVIKQTGEGLLDIEWFSGARFNFAENCLRIRDDRLAIIWLDESGCEERITFAEMFEEVKLYAAAFRKNGLQKGDRVSCYCSNRKEAIFTFLAAVSIGAIFGGPQPYLGKWPASNIISKMEPKFLLVIDHHLDSKVVFSNIDHLPEIVEKTPSLEGVIIIPSYPDTKTRDLSHIKNSILLEDFLNSGRDPDGNVPDIQFEQLPFDYPICMNFTSGTTGLPKGPVHAAGSFISHLKSVVLYWDLKCGDVIYTCYPVGWTLWDAFVPGLAWGVTLFLYSGCPFYTQNNTNLWDLLAKYKVTYAFLATAIVDILMKNGEVPGPNSNLDNLRFLTMGGSPVKAQNTLYVYNNVKKDMFICSQYGSTEAFGTFSGFDLNLPCYATEIQAPALGMDLHCFDEEGNSVMNKRGEMVLCKPTPALPIGIWKDEGNKIFKETYLTKYPGTWCQSDEIWINPKTRGIVVIGRSDDTLIQHGDRFGAGDIYSAIFDMEEIKDAICVGQTRDDGDCRAVLFIQMREGHVFTPEFVQKVEEKIAKELWHDCVPKLILETKGIPYNLSNKKMESTIRKIVATNKIPDVNNIKNPECLQLYIDIPELVDYYKN